MKTRISVRPNPLLLPVILCAFLHTTLAIPGPSPVLFDGWYTITLGKGPKEIHYGYYNDRIEVKKGKIFYQNHVWKHEEDYINEEQLGAFAESGPDLKPLFFNFHSTYRTTETSIDGTVTDGRFLTVKVRKGGSELPAVKKSIPPKTIFSVFFPLWLRRRSAEFQLGKPISFRAILEDNIEQGFSAVSGTVRMEKPDDFATRSGTRKFTVDYRGLRSSWWLDPSGTAIRMEMPQQKMLVQKVTQAEARGFIGGPSSNASPLPEPGE